MSSIQLLDKTRKINKLLHNNNSQKVVFNDICKVLTEVMNSNVLVISKKGKILGKNEADHIEVLHQLISGNVKDYVDFSLNERLLTILSTNENVSLSTLGFESDVDDYYAIIAPIDIAGERFGTLFMYRQRENYSIDDIILAEYGTTVVGLEMFSSVVKPERQLAAFRRLTLAPGESRRVELNVGPKQLRTLGPDYVWRVEPGKFELQLGDNAENILLRADLTVE